VTRSTNRSTPQAPAPCHPATVRNVTLGTASVRRTDGLARADPADSGARAGWPGHTATPTIVPVREVLREMLGEAEGVHPEAGARRPGRRQPSRPGRPGAGRRLRLVQRVHPRPGRSRSGRDARPALLGQPPAHPRSAQSRCPVRLKPADHDPPHAEGLELTRDGSAPTYAMTAPTSSALSVPPPRWPTATFGFPNHALLPLYSSTAGPHAAPTHLVAPPPAPGPHGPSAGPGMVQR
jgi:hypothetical protein